MSDIIANFFKVFHLTKKVITYIRKWKKKKDLRTSEEGDVEFSTGGSLLKDNLGTRYNLYPTWVSILCKIWVWAHREAKFGNQKYS